MMVLNLELPYKKKISIPQSILNKLPRSLALVSTVQYISQLDNLAEELRKQGKKVIIPYFPGTFYKGQILGCSINEISGNFESFLYIGEGRFHPLTLLYKNDLKVYCFNPQTKALTVLDEKDKKAFVKRRKAMKSRFLSANNVGLLISIKPGQYYLPKLSKIESLYPDKKFYPFIGGTIDLASLQDFSFIDCFVNTACPRIAYDNPEELGICVLDIPEIKELYSQDV